MKTDLPSIATEFKVLARRFREYGSRAKKPNHLVSNIQQVSVQAGRLLRTAGEAGAFAGDPWWPDGKSLVHPYDDGKGGYLRYESDEEFCASLWTFAIGSWLAKRFPERFRHEAATWDWLHAAKDDQGRLLDKNGEPLRRRWYKDGQPLPDSFQWTEECKSGNYGWKLDGRIAHVEDFYDEIDCMEHLRIRAEVYSDACRLLSELLGLSSRQVPSSSTEGAAMLSKTAKSSSRSKRGPKPQFDRKKDKRIADAWLTHRYKSHADLEEAFDLPAGGAKRALDRHRKRAVPPK